MSTGAVHAAVHATSADDKTPTWTTTPNDWTTAATTTTTTTTTTTKPVVDYEDDDSSFDMRYVIIPCVIAAIAVLIVICCVIRVITRDQKTEPGEPTAADGGTLHQSLEMKKAEMKKATSAPGYWVQPESTHYEKLNGK